MIRLILSTLLFLSLVSCTNISAPPEEIPVEYTPPDIIVMAVPTLPLTLPFYATESLHPTLVKNQLNGDLSALLYEGLFVLDENFQPQALLVESIETSDDGYRWIFTLKEEILFWDDTPLTGQIVVSAWNEARSSASRYSNRFASISSFSATTNTVTVNLKYPNYNLPSLLDIPISYGGGALPQGTGPYLYEEESSFLSRNPNWWGSADLPDTIALLQIQEKEDLISAFDAGKISILRTDLISDQSLGFSGNYHVWQYPSAQLYYLGFNGNKLSASQRQALSLAIDRESLLTQELAGYGTPTTYPVSPQTQVGQELGAWSYDPIAVAEEIESKSALPSKLSLLVNKDNPQKTAIATEIARQLEEFSIDVTVNPLPWEDFLLALEKGNFDFYLSEINLTPDFDITNLLAGGDFAYGVKYDSTLEILWNQYQKDGISALGEEEHFFQQFSKELPFAPLCFYHGTAISFWGHLEEATPTANHLFYQLEDWTIVEE